MRTPPNNGGAAFPLPDTILHEGMSLRDYFAGKALPTEQLFVASENENRPIQSKLRSDYIAASCYQIADAMIIEAVKQKSPVSEQLNRACELEEIAEELVRLHDFGVRLQIIKGCHREEQDFDDMVSRARKVLRKGTK